MASLYPLMVMCVTSKEMGRHIMLTIMRNHFVYLQLVPQLQARKFIILRPVDANGISASIMWGFRRPEIFLIKTNLKNLCANACCPHSLIVFSLSLSLLLDVMFVKCAKDKEEHSDIEMINN
jgi:hypothetical protein